MKQLTLRALAAFALIMGVSISAQAQKIAVLDSREVLSSLPETQVANTRIQAIQKSWEDSLQMMQVAMQSKADAYKKVLDTMTPERKEQANQELAGMQDQMLKYRDAKFSQNGELAQQQQSILQPIFDKTKYAIAALVKKEKYTIVMDKNSVLNSDGAIDITQKLIQYLKTGK
jgi:outer membrane protein